MGVELTEARVIEKTSRFKRYQGPRLVGPRSVLSCKDHDFPEALRQIPRPPEALYVIGDVAALGEGLAVIGARKATPYGIACAEKFAGIAARHGIPIISGGAYGCDAAAHHAALDADGKTVVFLGGGCDEVYPPRHFDLFQEVIESGGAVVSEHEWSYPALPHTFRTRNRLIAGLARATLIVEAGIPSGTFSTADEALAASKDVLVVPGPISSATSRGANRLLYQGAIPIVDEEGFEDVISGLFDLLRQEVTPSSICEKDDFLLSALQANPMRINEMIALGSPAATRLEPLTWLTVHLAELERDGLIARFPDGRYGPAKL